MQYGQTLKKAVYKPWQDKYIDYDKLKKLLKDSGSDAGLPGVANDNEWTEDDEGAFVEELVNVQLEKVADFQQKTLQRLQDETSECEKKLEPLGVGIKQQDGDADGSTAAVVETGKPEVSADQRKKILNDVLKKLDSITKETNELEKYSRINYTGFLKSAKKHDRRRGQSYRVRPLLQVRLAALPFHSEDYSPLLYRLSAMYSFVRQSLDGKDHRVLSFSENQSGADSYTSHKFWVHPENLLEVKTVILRRLPVLVYNPQTSKIADGAEPDPTITSIYFDDPTFDLYTKKISNEPDATSLRLRWYGQLADSPEVLFERKVIRENDVSEEERFSIKEKYVKPFIDDKYHMEKNVNKLKERDSAKGEQLESAVSNVQTFIRDNKLQPIVRANYARTAFEIPGDDRIRISLDTNLAFIREDAIDTDRPCRDPEDWHRRDIDDAHLEFPFTAIRKGEISRFPFALLEIKIKGSKRFEWIDDLMNSHLVKEAPRFSKFLHGVATLFEDYVNTFPFWLSQVETDIRRDPQVAFEEEQERKQQIAQDELVVGSLFGPRSAPGRHPFRGSVSSPVGSPANKNSFKPGTSPKVTADMTRVAVGDRSNGKEEVIDEEDSDDDGIQGNRAQDVSGVTGLRTLFPAFSSSRYARSKRAGRETLPPGVEVPTYWLKDVGPVKVEPKVWLANQRTFIKWQHFAVLLASLSLGLFNAAGTDNNVGRALGFVYTLFALFACAWGWGVYMWRSNLIKKRSGTDFDARLGPIVVAIGLAIALIVNYILKVRAAVALRNGDYVNSTIFYSLPHSGDL